MLPHGASCFVSPLIPSPSQAASSNRHPRHAIFLAPPCNTFSPARRGRRRGRGRGGWPRALRSKQYVWGLPNNDFTAKDPVHNCNIIQCLRDSQSPNRTHSIGKCHLLMILHEIHCSHIHGYHLLMIHAQIGRSQCLHRCQEKAALKHGNECFQTTLDVLKAAGPKRIPTGLEQPWPSYMWHADELQQDLCFVGCIGNIGILDHGI